MNGLKKVDVFNDVVSRLEDSKKAKVSDDVVTGLKNYYNQNYRSRVNLLSENLKGVKPIDSNINNVIYLSDFIEKGIAIKSPLSSFKQIWVEYRLIYNENNYKKEENIQEDKILFDPIPEFKEEIKPEPVTFTSNLTQDLDDNYKKLYNKVLSLNKYVEDFNKKKLDLDRQIASLEEKKRNLSNELAELEHSKKEFERYKKSEEDKITSMKNEVNGKVISLQNLIDNLDNILGTIS